MKNLILTSLLICTVYFCQSQNKPNSQPAKKSSIYSQYVGKYHLKNPDSLVNYDYFNITEKDGKLYCSRNTKIHFMEASSKKMNNSLGDYECEITYINLQEQKISLKFLNVIYNYTFRINPNTKRSEIVIIDSVLVYEKR